MYSYFRKVLSHSTPTSTPRTTTFKSSSYVFKMSNPYDFGIEEKKKPIGKRTPLSRGTRSYLCKRTS